jgi:RNA polymerase sigma-70 factor (ECF subfamily)
VEHLLDDEAELVLRAAQRDVAAWSTLYEAHYNDVYAYAYSRLGSREEAEDVASQVFVEALRNIGRLAQQLKLANGVRRARPLLSWLLDFARKLTTSRQRIWARARREASLRLVTVDDGDTESLLDHLDLVAALKHLTTEQQDIIILRFFMAKTTPEIAAIMGRNENAVFALQFRAVKALRRHLAADAVNGTLHAEAGES